MKFLHTSDWHLGQTLLTKSRYDEHKQFLDWLIKTINFEEIELLIVSGDIFDTGAPPGYALKMYYDFLNNLTHTCCKKAIIVGGNHDSPITLNASADLLNNLGIHVIGKKSECIDDHIIEVKNSDGKLNAFICAVPFLRDRDVRNSVAGESYDDKNVALMSGIKNFYCEIAEAVKLRKAEIDNEIPVIATGHLFADNSKMSDSERDIYVGNLHNFKASDFSEEFTYMALGHLHIPQVVAGNDAIRYSGSPIPMSFDESSSEKIVVVGELSTELIIKEVSIPSFQPLKLIRGNLQFIEEYFKSVTSDAKHTWIEVRVTDEKQIALLDDKIMKFSEGLNVSILAIKIERNISADSLSSTETPIQLNELEPIDVFRKRIECEPDMLDEEVRSLSLAFEEILNEVITGTKE